MKKRIITALLLAVGLLTGCYADPAAVDSPDRVHAPLTIFAPDCEIDDFIDEVHRVYPEINF